MGTDAFGSSFWLDGVYGFSGADGSITASRASFAPRVYGAWGMGRRMFHGEWAYV